MNRQNSLSGINTFFRFYQHTGDSLFLFPLFLILFFFGSGKITLYAGMALAGMAITGVTVWTLKMVTRKKRPAGQEGKLVRKFDPYSFPSGHAARAFSLVAVFLNGGQVLAIGTAIWACLISFSRLKLKLHFWFDVLAGILIGFGIGILVNWLSLKLGLPPDL